MSELAFDMNGDAIVLPATAQYWRVRRFRNPGKQGAPEIVESKDGGPLLLAVDCGFIEFREAVDGLPGRYRLDPVDEKRKLISNAPAAYLTIAEPPRNGNGPVMVPQSPDGPDTVMRELARANVEMARVNAEVSRNIADRFAGIMQAAAEVIRAADGAGIVARQPLELPVDDLVEDEPEEEEEEIVEEAEPTFAGLAAQILPMIQMWLQVKQAKAHAMSKEPEHTDQKEETATEPKKPAPVRNAMPTQAQMEHLMAVQNRLTPEEAQVAQATAMKLSPEDRADLLAELEEMSVEEAAKFVRSMLPKMKGGPS